VVAVPIRWWFQLRLDIAMFCYPSLALLLKERVFLGRRKEWEPQIGNERMRFHARTGNRKGPGPALWAGPVL
jgi:hypothetical protein